MKNNIFGTELILDLHNCAPATLRSKAKLRKFVIEICEQIDMKRFGKPFIERFGFGKDFTAGYSVVQLIESSSITGHFSELWNSAYINIFSCKPFNTKKAREFTVKFFGAKKVDNRVLVRK